jgi:hypothetical protein
MLRARAAVGVALAVSAIGGAVLVGGGSEPGAAPGESCADGESTFTTDSLHDLRSFADAVAIVRGVRESVPPPPRGPEGYAGLIGRKVTARVERILWRRPNAPEPPRRFRFGDLGWTGTLENRRPLVICDETRMELGRRYLAPIARQHGVWFPFSPTRLRLEGDRVVGGVDAGEPENSHQALAGRSVRGAARLVAQTKPYRAVVLHPEGSPADRWQRVNRDRYRLWRERPGTPVVVTSGVTPKSRWQLYLRLPRRGGMCVGISARPLWRPHPAPSGEGCGPRTLAPTALRPSLFYARHRGWFAFGRVGQRAWDVRVRFDGEDWKEPPEIPTPIPPGGPDYFWVQPAEGRCPAIITVQARDGDGNLVREERYAACRSG